ncbi:SPX domain-containing protein [Gongronella butleri]|nr:SPX domain-containing protein [Gongronella butleri]
MKFSHSLIVNAVPDWLQYYIDYDHLKKIVYQIERIKVLQREPANDSEKQGHGDEAAAAGLTETINDDDAMFLTELDKQLDKIISFYTSKSREILDDASTLREQFDDFGVAMPAIPTTAAATMTTTDDLDRRASHASNSLVKLDSILAGNAPSSIVSEPDDQGVPRRRSTFSSIQGPHGAQSPAQPPTKYTSSPTTIILEATAPGGEEQTVHHRHTNMTSHVGTDLQRRRSVAIEDQVKHPFWEHRRASIPPPGSAKDMEKFNQYQNFRARCATTYINLAELKSYVETNETGFRKILKKWDKVTGSNLKHAYFEKIVMTSEPFLEQNLAETNKAMNLVCAMYAAVFTRGDTHAAESELKLHMRDHITFERTTVWKDMVGKERLTLDAHAAEAVPGYKLPFDMFLSQRAIKNFLFLCVAVIFYAVFMSIDVLGDEAASKCLALLLLAALMWAFECIPLYATAYLMPLLIPPMYIIKQNGVLVDAGTASKLVFQSMFSGTIMVLLGGFAIAAALSKYGVAKAFASVVLSHAGTRPAYVILVVMYLAAFLSMWISNVATPVLCFSLVQPILRTLPPMSTMGPALILGIALGSCIGGLTSPISSPQNIITLEHLVPNIGWEWLSFSIPIAIITIITTWGMILVYFKPWRGTPRLNTVRQQELSWPNFDQVYVTAVCLVTIALWCSESALASFWGDTGVIAALPIVLLFGTGHLTKTDLNNFLWSVVVLAQGGMALGFAVQYSGLLDIIGNRIAGGVQHMQPLAIVFIFGFIVLVFATFVSHTVAALIIIPIVQQVGNQLHPIESNLLVTVTGLVCSVAMGLSVSGFPNMSASMLEDPTGKPYLRTKDFILCGVPASIIAAVITILLGYGIVGAIITEPAG